MNDLGTSAVDWSQIWIITVVGYSVVFVALVVMVFVFIRLPKILKLNFRRKKPELETEAVPGSGKEKYLSGEVSAAIGMALTLYFKEQHDEESGILTIKRVSRTYSPWSSKIYGVNNNPR